MNGKGEKGADRPENRRTGGGPDDGGRGSGSRLSAALWAVYLAFLHFVDNEYLGFFVVAILITIYSEIWARVLKTPATTILMPTVIPLIPGGSLYYAMDAAFRHDAPEFILKAQKAIGLAVALVAGIMIVTSLRRPIEALVHIVAKKKY